MDEQAGMIGDWMLPIPSPSSKAFIPSFLGEDAEFSFGPMKRTSNEDKDAKQGDFSFDSDMILKPLCGNNSSSRGGLAARIAARAGFNAPRLNTESVRSKSDGSSANEAKSTYLTIPSGISPTALLESPVFISNSLNQASPTTGKFQLFADGKGKSFSINSKGVSKDNNLDKTNETSSFAFRPHGEPALPFSLSAVYKASQNMNLRALSDAEVSVKTENTSSNFEPSQVQSYESLSKSFTDKDSEDRLGRSEIRSPDTTNHTTEHSPPLSDEKNHDQSIDVDSIAGGGTCIVADDGYHWRKFGQKQVKGSECPRSYYKCSYLNCPVKKKVESTPEGQITEVIYKGSHNHPKPAPNHVLSVVSCQFDHNHNQVIPENNGYRSTGFGVPHNGLHLGNRRDAPSEQNSTSLMNLEIHHSLSSAQMQSGILESGDDVAGSSTYSNGDDQNDRGTHGSLYIDQEDESESKRRRTETETFAAELGSGATRAIREPRVVVQTRSDVDILDDGYRWRKYGQKVVKGNPNPRSYYKCTYVGCTVRKHVERASNDHRSVITTYEGKHNHDVPAARNNSHSNSHISAGIASLHQNLIPPQQQPHHGSFNRPMIQPQLPTLPQQHPHGFQVNGTGFMMSRENPNSAPNLYRSNGYNQFVNRPPPSGP